MDMMAALESIILERRCPECGDDNLYFLPHRDGETFDVECDTCGESEEFTPEQIAEIRPHVPDSAWRTIHNWQD